MKMLGDLMNESGTRQIAWRKDRLICLEQFRADVAGAAAAFAKAYKARLFCEDSYLFAVGLFGLLHAGADIILPAHAKSSAGDGIFVGDADVQTALNTAPVALTPFDSSRLALTFYTSGSTGAPKAVIKSLSMFEREIAFLQQALPIPVGNVLATVSHQHVYGLTFKLLWPLMAGKIFRAETFDLWEQLTSVLGEADVIVTSPAHLERLAGIRLPHGKHPARILSAGAPLSLAAAREAERIFGCLPDEIFGSSETGAFATRRQTKADAAWQVLPGMKIWPNDQKQLMAHTPHTAAELATGDLAEQRADGFHFLGRSDRIAKIEGKRIHLAEVEQALARSPWVQEAVTLMVPAERERLGAALVLTLEGRERLQNLGKFRFGRLLRQEMLATCESAAVPRLWRYLDALPMRAMGKRNKDDLLALFDSDA